MQLRPIDPDVSFPELECARLDVWDEKRIFERSVEERAGAKPYIFYDGPPFATGLPHYGHLVASILKDIVPRYWSMKGFRVDRRWGWDCHGLPVENEAQKELHLADKRAIDELGIEAFNGACRDIVLRYTEEWKRTIRRLGRWVDFERGYKTMDTSFMESVWWVFHQLWERGLIYRGHFVQPVSPALGTPLSNFEVALGPQEKDPVTRKEGHKRRQDPSVTLRFQLEDEDASLWAWTTTPWTLPSNLALAVHPAVEYVKVRVLESGELAYLEPSRLADYQARGRVGETEELLRVRGAELVGRPYQPLFPYFEHLRLAEDGSRLAFRVVAAEYVGTDAGTGIVHQAPAFGEDDFLVGQAEGLPLVRPVDLNGIFGPEVTDFAGQFVKDADKGILALLKERGRLVDRDTIVHAYPHCYRTEQPLLYMAISTWFMKVEGMRDELVANNDQVHWVPEYMGSGRFGNWLKGARDWNLSRNRYWGTPLPIWVCDEDESDMVCIGSRKQLEQLAGLPGGSLDDLHRDRIDAISFPSKRTPGGTMRRVAEVFDCWFESGSMPYAEHHYPFENRDLVERALPADYIAEGQDQTRGWFYTLTVLSTALFGRPAFKNVIVNGIVLAENGEKMSKSKRNFPDPNLVLDKYGSDALRIYLIDSPVVNAKDLRFSEAGVVEHVRSVLLPLWNSFSFLTRYAAVEGWGPDGVRPDPGANELDGWILSRLQSLIQTVNERMADYELFRVVPALLEFIDELTNWYIRRSRRRFWDGELNAYRTLHEVLLVASRVLAPFLPFIADEIYTQLAGPEGRDSVHLEDFPELEPALLDPALERRMQLARAAVGLGRGLRSKHNAKVRQPLPSLTLVALDEDDLRALEGAASIIADELNVKQVHLSRDESALVQYTARPNLKLLGPLYGKQLGVIKKEVQELASETLAGLLRGESIASEGVEGLRYDQESLLVDRSSAEGMVVDSDGRVTVALDLSITPELRREGLAREVINRTQNLRKERGLELDDRIRLGLRASGELEQSIREYWSLIRDEVLCLDAEPVFEAAPTDAQSFDVEGEALEISLRRES